MMTGHTSLADWWNPVDWLQGAGGALHGVFNIGDSVKNALGGVLTILQQFFRFFTDTGHFLVDAITWLSNALFPTQLQTWFLGTVGQPGSQWNSADAYQNLFQVVQGPGIGLAAAAAAARLLRNSLDHRISIGHALVDVLPRFLMTVALIGIPGTGVSAGYSVLAFCINASMTVAAALFTATLHASLMQGMQPGEGWFTHIFQLLSNAGRDAVAVVIGAIPLLVLALYAVVLMVVRTILLGFCLATAPLCVATVAFDGSNRFLRWWSDLFVGALMTPIIFAVAIGVSVTLASAILSAPVVGPILAFFTMCGGLWMSGKLVHQLTWRHFNHGGALAGFAAGVSSVLGPVHRLATAGYMAEVFGANRSGDNRAVNLMKRIGLASQGFNPDSGVSSGMAAAGGGHRSSPGDEPAVNASDGPPDVGEALGAPGRAAISGVRAAFAQHAFNAFASSHPGVIGRSTRDHPAGSISQGDRAKLAWNRLSPSARTRFAEDYLSVWLGSGIPDRSHHARAEASNG